MHVALMWLAYLVGQLVSLLMKADLSARSPQTPWNSIKAYIHQNRDGVLVRFFIASCLFWVLNTFPSAIAQAVGGLGYQIPKQLLTNYGTAGVYGAVADKLVDYLLERYNLKVGG